MLLPEYRNIQDIVLPPAGAGLIGEFESNTKRFTSIAGQRETGLCTNKVSLWLEEHVAAGKEIQPGCNELHTMVQR